MSDRYCHRCAVSLRLLADVFTSEPLANAYQAEKFEKHTRQSTDYPLASVFNSTSTDDYADYIVRAGSSGVVEIDDLGRRNLMVLAWKPVGIDGLFGRPADAVKVVLTSESEKVHAYPISEPELGSQRCGQCGVPLSY